MELKDKDNSVCFLSSPLSEEHFCEKKNSDLVYFLPYLLHIIKLSTFQPVLIYIRCYLKATELELVFWAMSLEDTESLLW